MHHAARADPDVVFSPDLDVVEQFAGESSRTTHGTRECIDACRLLGRIICRALLGKPKDEVILGDADSFVSAERIAAIAGGAYRTRSQSHIRGSGYVVESLEAALWAFTRTNNFADAVLLAANLGEDADTTAACVARSPGPTTASRVSHPTGWSAWRFVRRSQPWPISSARDPKSALDAWQQMGLAT